MKNQKITPRMALNSLNNVGKRKWRVPEIAQLAGVSPFTVLHLIQRGKIVPAANLVGIRGGGYIINRTELRRYLQRRVKRIKAV